MASSGQLTKLACIVMICMVLSTHHADAITCNDVVRSLLPCLGYLRSGGAVPGSCCNGVRSLNSAARTTTDRQAACGCIKQAANAFRLGYGYASSLPGKCDVSIPYQIGPNVDCSRLNA
ncbi:Non-specific lipid-transfer protein-like protein [Drosera capensis]